MSSSGLSSGRSSRSPISSVVTAIECGSSSRTPSSAASRISSATSVSSGSSVMSPSGYSANPSGSSFTSSSATRSTWKPDVADTGTIEAHSIPADSPSAWISARCSTIRSGSTRSALVASATFGVFATFAASVTRNRSPGPILSLAGRQTAITSTSAQVVFTTSFNRSPSNVRGLCRPGVSTRISCASGRCTIPRTACRVVCGFDDVMTIFFPTSALVSVDLPALGRPTKQAKPARKAPPSVPGFSGVDDIADLSGAFGVDDGDVGAGEVPDDLHVDGVGVTDHRGGFQALHAGRQCHRDRQLQRGQLDGVECDRAGGVRAAVGVPYRGAFGSAGPGTGRAGERDEFGVLRRKVGQEILQRLFRATGG